LIKIYIDHIIKKKTFEFNGVTLPLFFHSYNNFGLTERSVEIPIIKYYLNRFPHDDVLEIGNVSKHYYDDFRNFKRKDTVDKHELSWDVINMDIKDFKSDGEYDFIYSISTFEHMDSDGGRNPDYIPINNKLFSSVAFANMDYVVNNLLAPRGKFIITFRANYLNQEVDNSIKNEEYKNFNCRKVNIYSFKRLNELGWKQTHSKNPYLYIMEITQT